MSPFSYRLIGAALVAAGALSLIYSYRQTQKSSVRYARDMLAFVRFAHDAIERRALPVPMIVSEYTELSDGQRELFSLASESSLAVTIEESDTLESRVKRIMLSFAHELGRGLTEASLALCDGTDDSLSALIGILEKEADEKGSVFASTVLFIAVSAILLLI